MYINKEIHSLKCYDTFSISCNIVDCIGHQNSLCKLNYVNKYHLQNYMIM